MRPREEPLVTMNPIQPFLDVQSAFVLDGGLATELEQRGYVLNDALWSARLLADAPDAIRQVHSDYFWAGADCGIAATYQATVPGFMDRGLSKVEAERLLHLAVDLVVEARDAFWAQMDGDNRRLRPLVAASIGPYGAYLADGSEYTGRYDLDESGLRAFHHDRWHLLAQTQADLLACETIPSFAEARVLASLLADSPNRWAWFSFSARDGHSLSDGTPVAEAAAFLNDCDRVAAIGINCTPPRFIPDLIREITAVSVKPVIVYPNSGERYDASRKCWVGESAPAQFGTYSREWRKLGAAAVGGCCRTTPAHIRQIRDRVRFTQ